MQADQIRWHYRQIRKSLSASEQQRNAIFLSKNIDRFLGHYRRSKIAAYLDTQAEISLNPWIGSTSCRKQVYLPMLYEPIEPLLRFAEINKDTRWKQNRYQITEPDTHWGNTHHARQLDIILMPLVAFDRQGNRMGMGGGFYDRTLSFRQARQAWIKPKLIGVAHSCQEHPGLKRQPWDVSLDGVITENEIIIPHLRNS